MESPLYWNDVRLSPSAHQLRSLEGHSRAWPSAFMVSRGRQDLGGAVTDLLSRPGRVEVMPPQ